MTERTRRHADAAEQSSVSSHAGPASDTGRAETNSAQRVLFGTLSAPDVVTAVVRRLRAAIGLGLLSDGDQLPKESDLARQLGVTNFALREALGRLRDQGLILTRPGKRGGSFVKLGPDLEGLARDELRAMSTTELRDLGDWRRMLVSASAGLAAQRGSESNVARLRAHAHEVATATTGPWMRRAYGRFHMELAAAGQSARMSRAELAMHEEFDWLLSLSLSNPEYRRQTAQELDQIASAVAGRHPTSAQRAAEKHSASIIDSLIRLRLNSIAAEARSQAADETAQNLASELRRMVDVIMKRLEVLADVAADLLRKGLDQSGVRNYFAQAAMSELLNFDFPIDGLGFMADVGAIPGTDLWIDWWHRGPEGVFADKRHNLDRNHANFYDYTLRDAFGRPSKNGEPSVEGPYFDFGGVNDYVLTFSFPVFVEDKFVGVTAADLLIADMESHLAPWLVASGAPRLVLDPDCRVIVSNSATQIVGDLVPTSSGFEVLPVGRFGWRVATAASQVADGRVIESTDGSEH